MAKTVSFNSQVDALISKRQDKLMRRYIEIYSIMLRNWLIRDMSFKANLMLWMVIEIAHALPLFSLRKMLSEVMSRLQQLNREAHPHLPFG
jgi:hypothetical protein